MSALQHFTSESLTFDPTRTYEQGEPTTFGKPVGFWVSVEGEDDWQSWVTDNMNADRLAHRSDVALAGTANILRIESTVGIDSLTARFAVQTEYDRRWNWREHDRRKWPIDWRLVAAQFDGVIIAPYCWSRRNSHDWYYGWDCASGCIWNLSAIASVTQAQVSA